MDDPVTITLIIVGGGVIVCLAGIAWLWATSARAISTGQKPVDAHKIAELEATVRGLRREVDEFKSRMSQ